MTATLRGADIVARVLDSTGHRTIFTLSGNHIMPLYDAALGTGLRLIHTRHEAAAVHMADAYARLTGEVGIALVTGGQGHTNAVAALTTAQCADASVVLLSGHAPLAELGRGAFQELAQAEMARPVTKASWTAQTAGQLGHDIAEAIRIARSGRPGPVHVSLPTDMLEAGLDDDARLWPSSEVFASRRVEPGGPLVAELGALLANARRPLILAGPLLCTEHGRGLLAELSAATGVPAIGMESPRGINDPSLGTFPEVLRAADLIVLLAKPHDFTLRFCAAPFVAASARLVVIDPDAAMLDRAAREQAGRVALSALADAEPVLRALTQRRSGAIAADEGWRETVAAAIAYRPQAWTTLTGKPSTLHPIEMARGIQAVLDRDPRSIFISDGGEVGQWAQAGITCRRRLINGVAGSIGSALPFAIAARTVEPEAPIIAVSGDGAIGFHISEIDTAVRHDLPCVVVVGNDAAWNAEHQIQLREYGAERAHSCRLLPTRYDEVAKAFGGHGELVTSAAELVPAIDRAIASRKPAIVNVMIEGHAAPIIRRG